MVKDPVWGMDVDPKKTSLTSDCQEQTYYFCSTGCEKGFEKGPQKYAVKAEGSHAAHNH